MDYRSRFLIFFVALVSTFVAQLLVLAALVPPRPITAAFSVAAVVTCAFGVASVIFHVPVLLMLRRVMPHFRPVAVGSVCAALFPISQLVLWLLFRESTDTWTSLAAWYVRFPGEMIATGVPLALGGFVFGTLFVRTQLRTAVG